MYMHPYMWNDVCLDPSLAAVFPAHQVFGSQHAKGALWATARGHEVKIGADLRDRRVRQVARHLKWTSRLLDPFRKAMCMLYAW